MAETMLQVFKRHRDCFDFTKEPDWQDSAEARQLCYERQQEREKAANEYVNGILAANDNWAEDINEDVNKLALSFQGILNKAERKSYREAADQFLHYVASALREHRVRQLSPLTRYRMGREEFPAMNIVTGLSRDEAAREYQKMKEQGFVKVYYFPTEAFPAVFTVLGYKPKGSKSHGQQKNAHNGTDGTGMGSNATDSSETPPAGKEMAEEWLSGKAKEVLDECVNCGLAEKKENGYYWIEGNQVTGWKIGLYGYFVLMVCEKLNWKKGKAERLDWQKFESVFRNHDKIVGTAKQIVQNYKKGKGVPTLYEKVDKLIEKVFDVNLTLIPKSLD